MMTKCYIIEYSTENETMFGYLDDFGFDYHVDDLENGYFEIYIDAYPQDIPDLESIMQWYV